MMTCRLVPNALRLRTEWLACAAVLLLAGSAQAQAQVRPNLTLRLGKVVPDDAYQANCKESSKAFGVDVQGGGRVFPQLGFDRHVTSNGVSLLYVRANSAASTYVGGARLENSMRATVGIGARSGDEDAYLEGVLRAGVLHARPGYEPVGANGNATYNPLVGGQASVVLFHVVVLSTAIQWTRLRFAVTPVNGGLSSTQTEWARMVTLQFGARLPIGPSSKVARRLD
jgi:hypothetical protein